jgi:magnesium chelatase family protein
MHTVRAGAFAPEAAESSAAVRTRVGQARASAAARWQPHGFTTNAEVSGAILRRRFRLSAPVMAPLKAALERGLLSIRGVDRSLRVAWTLADLAGRMTPDLNDVSVALSFRQTEITP